MLSHANKWMVTWLVVLLIVTLILHPEYITCSYLSSVNTVVCLLLRVMIISTSVYRSSQSMRQENFLFLVRDWLLKIKFEHQIKILMSVYSLIIITSPLKSNNSVKPNISGNCVFSHHRETTLNYTWLRSVLYKKFHQNIMIAEQIGVYLLWFWRMKRKNSSKP